MPSPKENVEKWYGTCLIFQTHVNVDMYVAEAALPWNSAASETKSCQGSRLVTASDVVMVGKCNTARTLAHLESIKRILSLYSIDLMPNMKRTAFEMYCNIPLYSYSSTEGEEGNSLTQFGL